jgi:hypothetical protein
MLWRWLLILALMVVALILWYPRQPVVYQLHVTNNSGQVVERVSLLDSGVVAEVAIDHLGSGETASLHASLKAQGVLRFQVEQGLNRLDGILEKDVSQLKHQQQFLVIHPNNRLLVTATRK